MSSDLLSKYLLRCLNTYYDAYPEMELDEICMMFLTSTLEMSKGKYGYVACGTALEPDKMKYTAMVGMEMYLKSKDIKSYKPNRTFFTPAHLRDKWILIPLSIHKKLHGVIGFENATDQPHEEFKKMLFPLVPQLASVILDAHMTARTVSTQQDLFLSTMSHEIRTPLNGIVGMSRILKESSPLSDEQKSYINIVSECTYQLMELINDILDFSKMDCDQLKLNNDLFDVRACVEEVYDLVYLRVQEKKINMWYNIDDTVPSFFLGDKKRFRQVILNLVNNSIKFTDRGNIDLRIYCLEQKLHVEVKDTGMGIPTAQRENVFKSFRQVRTQKPNADGVGLGLAICKKLCKLMGGDIYIQSSNVGQGTCVHFYIPLEEPQEQIQLSKEKELSMEFLRDKKILLIDPRLPHRFQLLEFLIQLHTHPYACGTVEEGMAYLNSIPMDLLLIDSDSVVLQKLTTPVPLPPIGHINKIELTDLPLLLSKLLKGAPKPPSIKNGNAVIPMDILIVEDNPYNMMVISEMLKKLGYEERLIDKAVTGTEAIQKAITKQYDVILMDLLLPTVDGISAGSQILNYYRARCPKNLKYTVDKYESLLPTIIALTAMVTSETQNRCKVAGFKGFLTKPLDKEELETMLTIVSKRRQQSRQKITS